MDTLFQDPTGDAIYLYEGIDEGGMEALLDLLSNDEEDMEDVDLAFGEMWGASKIFGIEMLCSAAKQSSSHTGYDCIESWRLNSVPTIEDSLKELLLKHIDEFQSRHNLSSEASNLMKSRLEKI